MKSVLLQIIKVLWAPEMAHRVAYREFQTESLKLK